MAANASVLLNRLLARARLRHLQVLVQVAELGSLKKAAQAIGMTQPAVTHVIADLEKLLGVELFQRHARGARPSAFCAELLPVARRMIHALGVSIEAVVARMEHGEGSVRLGASAAAVSGLLADALPAFHEKHPHIQVQLNQVESDALGLLVTRGEVDLMACREPGVIPEGWAFTPLRDDRFVVACGPGHPLARRRRLTLADLADETWLPPPVSTAGRRFLDALLARQDVPPRYCQVTTVVTPVIWAFLARHRIIMLVPYSVVRQLVEAGQLMLLAVDEPMAFEPLGLLSPTDPPGPATQAVVDFLTRFGAATRRKGRGPRR